MSNQLIQYKDNANVGPANDVSSIGAGGLFSQVGQNPVISAVTGLKSGFESMLPIRASLIENPQVKIITGIDEAVDASGSDCGRYPTAGQFKICHINDYPFARYGMKSRTVDLTEIGLVDNNWTNQGQGVIGDPFMNDARMNTFPSGKPSYADIARRTVSKILNEMAFSASVEYGRQAIYGNPANNDPATSDVQEMRGLSLLVNDNYSDSVTGVDCDRVDSIVQDMVGKTVEGDTSEIIQRFVDILATLEQRQFLMGGAEAWDGFVVMHFNLFRKLVNNWPDTYYSFRTAANTSTIANLDSIRLQEMRNQMLTGKYLISDRGNIPVVTDPAVIESTGTVGTKSSDIWFVNRTFMGQVTTYTEYFAFDMAQTAMGAIESMTPNYNKYRVTDNGRFLLWNNTENTCVRANMVYRPRLRIDTPFLCATMQNVEYSPDLLIQETPFPGDAGYLNGGVTGPYSGAEGTTATITACTDVSAGELDLTLDNKFDWALNNTVYVTIGNVQIPAKATAIDNTAPFAPIVSVDFTDATVTPAFYATLVCADLSFVGGQLITPYQEQ